MKDLVENLKKYLRETPREQLEKDWAEIEAMDLGGRPTVEEFFAANTPHWFKGSGDLCERCNGGFRGMATLITEANYPANNCISKR
jgi:hypothetical protein